MTAGPTAAMTQPASLPSPEERPGADVVIYDGDCRICTAQMRKLTWWDCQGRLAYLSLHEPIVAQRYPDLSHEQLMQEMVVVDRAGRRHPGAEAIRYLSRRLRRLWWLAPFMHLPGAMFFWRRLYRWIAANRYRFGRTESCADGSCSLHHAPKKR